MTELNAATARRISADWNGVFPAFTVWKPLRLLRRLGPIVQGITLERSSSGDLYLPTAHVHSLAREFPVVTMTLAERLRSDAGVALRIRVADHDVSFGAAAARLRAQSQLSLDEPPTPDDVLRRYQEVILEGQRAAAPSGVVELEDMVAISTILGDSATAQRGIGLAKELTRKWSRSPSGWPDSNAWIASLETLAADPSPLRRRVASEVDKQKLNEIPSAWGDADGWTTNS
jgi:hypothetical protein